MRQLRHVGDQPGEPSARVVALARASRISTSAGSCASRSAECSTRWRSIDSMCSALGDRLGVFKDLAGRGPATGARLAGRTGLNERYVREWPAGMYAAG